MSFVSRLARRASARPFGRLGIRVRRAGATFGLTLAMGAGTLHCMTSETGTVPECTSFEECNQCAPGDDGGGLCNGLEAGPNDSGATDATDATDGDATAGDATDGDAAGDSASDAISE